MTALREGNIVLRAELFPRSTSSDLPHRSFVPLAANPPARPPAATPDHPLATLVALSLSPSSSFSLCLSFSLAVASLFAAFHEAQHLPVVTKKSSNHPRRSSGGLSFALLLLGWVPREREERLVENARRERIATEGGRKGERGARYTGCKANRAREGETERRRVAEEDEGGRSEVRGRKTVRGCRGGTNGGRRRVGRVGGRRGVGREGRRTRRV